MSNNISFSPINFNLYISNNNKESDYVYVTLPTNASNNAPLLKYNDHYFVPFSVSCVKKKMVSIIL